MKLIRDGVESLQSGLDGYGGGCFAASGTGGLEYIKGILSKHRITEAF